MSRRLTTIPGVGPITASAIVATAEDGRQFRTAHQLAAWIRLVPRQRSSGGKDRLGSISKRGDPYLHKLLLHGARSVVRWRGRMPISRPAWVERLLARRPVNVAVTTLANKNARVAWALLQHRKTYRSATAAGPA